MRSALKKISPSHPPIPPIPPHRPIFLLICSDYLRFWQNHHWRKQISVLPWISLINQLINQPINQLINQPINHRGWRDQLFHYGSGRSRVTPHLSASGVVDPHPGTFYEFLVKRVVTPHSPGPHWGVGLPHLRLPGVVSPPVMGLQACPNLLFGENPYRRLDPKIPVMGENRDRYLFCAAWHGGHSGTGLGLWWPLVSEKNGKSVILGKKKRAFLDFITYWTTDYSFQMSGFITNCSFEMSQVSSPTAKCEPSIVRNGISK